MTQQDQFPAFADEQLRRTTSRSPGATNGSALHSDRWQPRKENGIAWGNGNTNPLGRGHHGRQKSLSDAFRAIRTRRGSVSANAREIAEAIKPPLSPLLIILCIIWYTTSALTNTSSKSILNAFRKPVTLTLIQFFLTSTFCIISSTLAQNIPALRRAIPALQHGIRPPSRDVLRTTVPLAVFQLGGHVLSSTATSQIPVSLVHTIKGLSPLFTVLVYRFFFQIHYASTTYLSLIPLTLGVMLACSAEFSGNFWGILCAFGGALIFVMQNISTKKLFNAASHTDGISGRKLDKLNLLCYSSGLAFLLTCPIWLWSEGFTLLADFTHDFALELSPTKDRLSAPRLALEFLFNGTFHFGQNIIAFVLLSMVSPVTYSVASLIKRIFVIVVAIVWFGQRTTSVQAAGIGLTFFGLYLYDRTSDAARADMLARAKEGRAETPLLPLSMNAKNGSGMGALFESPHSASSSTFYGNANGYLPLGDEKKSDGPPQGRPRGNSMSPWLPPGTRQEETWRPRDIVAASGIPA
ncbi:MAG: suppressor of loss of ypt1 [Vezdaea acicularis]|nr:MAG: suppressor of loss of ypt1 [Vezdaea acicularis]